MASDLTPNLLWTLLIVFSSLTVASFVRLMVVRRVDSQTRARRLASLRTWWMLAIVLAAAVLLGRLGVCLLFAVASGVAMREYVQLVATRPADRWGVRIVYLAIPLQYGLIYCANSSTWQQGFLVMAPLGVLLMLAAVRVWQDETKDYIRSTAGLTWGFMVLVYGLSHAAMLTTFPSENNPVAGPVGWLLYLVLLTETDDIAQALAGRRWGAHKRHRIAPRISPNKTWEGLLGGLLVTIILAAVLSPLLTPLHHKPLHIRADIQWQIPFFWPAVAGLLISVSGFIGDINMSAVKRDMGVKDSSSLLPGMGGMIDRIDSLTFAAPVFYYLARWIS